MLHSHCSATTSCWCHCTATHRLWPADDAAPGVSGTVSHITHLAVALLAAGPWCPPLSGARKLCTDPRCVPAGRMERRSPAELSGYLRHCESRCKRREAGVYLKHCSDVLAWRSGLNILCSMLVSCHTVQCLPHTRQPGAQFSGANYAVR